jgi:pyrroline-5-carboxylate reductase
VDQPTYALGVNYLGQENIQNKIIFIGGGNLAQAIFSKLNLNKYHIEVVQHNHNKIQQLKQIYPNIKFSYQLEYKPDINNLVVLAVKPQDAKQLCISLQDKLQDTNIISVMAGITISSLTTWLNNHKVTRVMPNVLVSVAYGTSGVFFNKAISIKIKNIIIDIFNSVGNTYIFDIEDDINKITAIAASSPAYLFYFLECMIKSTINLGIDEQKAKDIVLQIVAGSVEFIKQNNTNSIENLRAKITSKNGTTEAAIRVLEKANLAQIVNDAENACYVRAQELSQESNT